MKVSYISSNMLFKNREEAGELLAQQLKKKNLSREDSIVLAIPRGGVVTGKEISQRLSLPLDIIVPRKLGAPGNPELAIGATTSEGGLVLDKELVEKLGITDQYVTTENLKEMEEAKRREKLFRRNRPYPELVGKTVVLVDDGVATGATVKAAINAIRKQLPLKVVLAVPVAPADTVEDLSKRVEETVVLVTPEPFRAVGAFYHYFPQVQDSEVIRLLNFPL